MEALIKSLVFVWNDNIGGTLRSNTCAERMNTRGEYSSDTTRLCLGCGHKNDYKQRLDIREMVSNILRYKLVFRTIGRKVFEMNFWKKQNYF